MRAPIRATSAPSCAITTRCAAGSARAIRCRRRCHSGSWKHSSMLLRRVRRTLACRLALYSDRALALLECSTPLATIAYTAGAARDALVVFLPGIGDFADDFERHGFIAALAAMGFAADALAVDAHYGYYGRRTVLERLAEDVVLPARAQGYGEIWLVGISMGGLGALSYVVHYPDHISRALLLAPYLGEPHWIQEVTDGEVRAAGPSSSRGHFAPANALFARHLPARHVLAVPGGHDWRTWRRLWQAFLRSWTSR